MEVRALASGTMAIHGSVSSALRQRRSLAAGLLLRPTLEAAGVRVGSQACRILDQQVVVPALGVLGRLQSPFSRPCNASFRDRLLRSPLLEGTSDFGSFTARECSAKLCVVACQRS
eukprot:TRINITY_DN114737_c0_g1_i1.p1 TRINITY_DN114737_c0_g1~~TRINITY_DN114737_c0_g1_i1.p1  ORF type:complete len:116 (-),score=20.84 TRINITY_DN114737_c0_g1_i1:17-364(-)